jgi:hypothetical protein
MTESAWKARISAANHELRDAEEALAAATKRRDAAREEVTAAVRDARPTECEATQEEFLSAIRPLYWDDPSIGGKALAAAAGFSSPAELTRAIGSAPSGVPCQVCGKDIPRTSRSSKTHESRTWAGSPICTGCYDLADAKRRRDTDVQNLRKHFVETSPVSALARDWEVAVHLILAYPPVATRVAQGSVTDEQSGTWLHYQRAQHLGERVASALPDAMVHVPVWLAQDVVPAAQAAAGWDVTRTREVVDTLTDEAALAVLTRLDGGIRAVVSERTAKAEHVYPDDYESLYEEIHGMYDDQSARYPRQ